MTVTCVVQARVGSTRLPGKVLAELAGRPMLGFLLARLQDLDVDHLVVATSELHRDDAVASLASEAGAKVFRGPESDVLARFSGVLEQWPADVVVRLTADCPLTDPAIVRSAIQLLDVAGAEYCSNSLVRTFPKGLDVEVMRAPALLVAATEAVDAAEREHVTPFLYRRPERYRLAALRTPELAGTEWWTVDTADDLDRLRAIVGLLDDPVRAGWQEVLARAGRRAVPGPGGLWVRPAIEDDEGAIAALAGDATSTVIGDPGTARPVGEDLTDPAVRTWVADAGGSAEGWVQVAVRGGEAVVRGRVLPAQELPFRAGLAEVFENDFQVARLANCGLSEAWRGVFRRAG